MKQIPSKYVSPSQNSPKSVTYTQISIENYQNLFPNFAQSLEAQKNLERERKVEVPANKFLTIPVSNFPIFVAPVLQNIFRHIQTVQSHSIFYLK